MRKKAGNSSEPLNVAKGIVLTMNAQAALAVIFAKGECRGVSRYMTTMRDTFARRAANPRMKESMYSIIL